VAARGYPRPMPQRSIPAVLSIAGSDSGGGAGIQADLKAFARCGVHGMTAITAITVQNTVEVRAVEAVSPETIVGQVRAVADDIGVDAVKVGMLGDVATIEAVARALGELPAGTPVVVDPVMVATSGARLLPEDAVALFRGRLLPLADILTPNLHEAAVLLGEEPADAPRWSRARQADAARAIVAMGPRAVLLKGGHRGEAGAAGCGENDGSASDVLATEGRVMWLEAPRVAASSTHGTGCTLAAGLAAGLALGQDVVLAAWRAKEHLTRALAVGLDKPLMADFTGSPRVRVIEEST